MSDRDYSPSNFREDPSEENLRCLYVDTTGSDRLVWSWVSSLKNAGRKKYSSSTRVRQLFICRCGGVSEQDPPLFLASAAPAPLIKGHHPQRIWDEYVLKMNVWFLHGFVMYAWKAGASLEWQCNATYRMIFVWSWTVDDPRLEPDIGWSSFGVEVICMCDMCIWVLLCIHGELVRARNDDAMPHSEWSLSGDKCVSSTSIGCSSIP